MLQIQKKAFSTCDSIIASFHNRRYRTPFHMHQMAELVYVMDGEFTVTTDLNKEVAKKGDVVIIQPYQPHGFFTQDGETVKLWMLLFSNSFVTDLILEESANNRYETVIFKPSDAIRQYIEARMFSTDEEKREISGSEFRRVKALLYSVLDEYMSQVRMVNGYDVVNAPAISSVINYISVHFRENITLDVLAAATGYSKSHISHSLSSMLAMNFKSLLNSFRVTYAKHLLITTDMSMYLVGLESGFGCERSFNRAFFQIMKTSPNEYREERLKIMREEKIIGGVNAQRNI